ncbi:MAG: helix-turn-helix transcriptional regulator [Chloroflexi bacterium]|nr:helix-turn-helix transcriptional regulator [Chloroflexota bacterium]
MIDQFTNLETDGEVALPTSSLDLSTRMRDLRARQGLKQSEVARRMGLDPSIPSLWEQGKRLVPANRVRSLADALEVSVEELLDGVSGSPRAGKAPGVDGTVPPRTTPLTDLVDERAMRSRTNDSGPLLRLLPQTTEDQSEPITPKDLDSPSEPWVVPERPALAGWIPDGWHPTDRIQDISPSLPDGYWLDPVKLEKGNARELLRSRLCNADRTVVTEKDVPGAAIAERLYRHCSRQGSFLPAARLPLAETIFRCVLAADHGGLTDGALVEMLRERAAAVPVSTTLLRRLRDSVKPYPIRRVDAELFGGRR